MFPNWKAKRNHLIEFVASNVGQRIRIHFYWLSEWKTEPKPLAVYNTLSQNNGHKQTDQPAAAQSDEKFVFLLICVIVFGIVYCLWAIHKLSCTSYKGNSLLSSNCQWYCCWWCNRSYMNLTTTKENFLSWIDHRV